MKGFFFFFFVVVPSGTQTEQKQQTNQVTFSTTTHKTASKRKSFDKYLSNSKVNFVKIVIYI